MATIQQQKIRIRLQAFDRKLLDASCEKIVDTANRTSATAVFDSAADEAQDLLRAAFSPRGQGFA